MDVRELQHRPATTCSPSAPIVEVARTMRQDNVGSVLVVDEHGALKGVVTDRDMVVRGIAEGLDGSAPVEGVMSRNVAFLYDNADVFAAASEMAEKGLRRLPVLDVKGHLTGVVSFDDLVVTFAEQIGRLGHAVRKEIQAAVRP
ncbi:MAG: CBS domain-containing protein [Actinomycetota bacterium]